MIPCERGVSDRGFSLIELMVVIAVGAVVSAIVVPQVQRSLAANRVHSSAVQVATELNYARTIALSRNAVLEIDFTTDSYQIVDPSDPDNPPRTRKFLEPGVRFVQRPVNPIRFFPRGNAAAGTVQIADEYGQGVVIAVSAGGMVEIREFTSGGELDAY